MRFSFACASFVSIAAAFAGTAAAQSDPLGGANAEHAAYCDNKQGKGSLDMVIGGCTALIRSGKTSGPLLALILTKRGEAYAQSKDYKEASSDFDQAMAVPGISQKLKAVIHGARAEMLRNQEKYDDALKSYNLALAIDPALLSARTGKAASLAGLKRFDEASAAYAAVAAEPSMTDDQRSYVLRAHGAVLAAQGKREEAVKALVKSTRIGTPRMDRVHIYRSLGILYGELNQPGMARQAFESGLGLVEDDAMKTELLVRKGAIYLDQEKWEEAATDFKKALEIDREYAAALRGLGKSKSYREDYRGAIADFTRSLEADPNSAYARFERGIAFAEIGEHDKALADYDAAVRLKPDAAEYRNSACWSRAAYLNREIQRALEECNEAVRLAPKSAMYLDSRGFVRLRMEQYKLAWADYDAAVKLAPEYGHALYGRGIAALRLGRKAEGEADLTKAATFEKDAAKLYAEYGIVP